MAKTDGFREALNREWRKRVDSTESDSPRAVCGIEQLLGGLEFRHQSVN